MSAMNQDVLHGFLDNSSMVPLLLFFSTLRLGLLSKITRRKVIIRKLKWDWSLGGVLGLCRPIKQDYEDSLQRKSENCIEERGSNGLKQ